MGYAGASGFVGKLALSGLYYVVFFAFSIYLAACLVYIGILNITCLRFHQPFPLYLPWSGLPMVGD